MTLDELKAEAEKLGYTVVKKAVPPGRLDKCPKCGVLPKRREDRGRVFYVVCPICGRQSQLIDATKLYLRKDEAIRATTIDWNRTARRDVDALLCY